MLVYYPPVTDFLWFTSRSVYLLNSVDNLPYPVMEQARDLLTAAMRGNGTDSILQMAQLDSTDNWVYWDDFLGDNDTNIFGTRENYAEDRLFTTAVAINALIDTWTYESSTCKREWISGTQKRSKAMLKWPSTSSITISLEQNTCLKTLSFLDL